MSRPFNLSNISTRPRTVFCTRVLLEQRTENREQTDHCRSLFFAVCSLFCTAPIIAQLAGDTQRTPGIALGILCVWSVDSVLVQLHCFLTPVALGTAALLFGLLALR